MVQKVISLLISNKYYESDNNKTTLFYTLIHYNSFILTVAKIMVTIVIHITLLHKVLNL